MAYISIEKNPETGAAKTIDYSHHEIHRGSHYFVSLNKDVANGGTFNLAFTTPNTAAWLHLIYLIDTEAEAEVILYEDITSFSGGTAVTPLNNDRNSANASGVVDMEYDTTPVLGTPVQLFTRVLGAGRDMGGATRNDAEIILKQNTPYYLLVTNQATGTTNEIDILLEWYEHTNR